MSKTENLKKAQRAASSPTARAKAVATMKRRRAEKLLLAGQQANTPMEGIPDGGVHMPLDAIPDREPKRKYARKAKQTGHWISDADMMILKMAKMMLKGGK